jgi:hypothetical protein
MSSHTNAKDFRSQALAIFMESNSYTYSDKAEARSIIKRLGLLQKRLRLLRSTMISTEKVIRAEGRMKRQTMSLDPIGALFAPGKAKSWRAVRRSGHKQGEDKTLQPYEDAKIYIDSLIQGLERAKISKQP